MTARLAPTTIDTRFTIVRGVFRAAVADRLIASDPTVGVVLPRKRKAEAAMRSPTTPEVAKVLNAAEPERPAEVAAGIHGLRRTVRLRGTASRRSSRRAGWGHRLPRSHAAGHPTAPAGKGGRYRGRQESGRGSRRYHRRDPVAEVRVGADHLPARRSDRDPLRARSPPYAGGRADRWLFDEDGKPWHDNLVDYRWRSTRADAGVHVQAARASALLRQRPHRRRVRRRDRSAGDGPRLGYDDAEHLRTSLADRRGQDARRDCRRWLRRFLPRTCHARRVIRPLTCKNS